MFFCDELVPKKIKPYVPEVSLSTLELRLKVPKYCFPTKREEEDNPARKLLWSSNTVLLLYSDSRTIWKMATNTPNRHQLGPVRFVEL